MSGSLGVWESGSSGINTVLTAIKASRLSKKWFKWKVSKAESFHYNQKPVNAGADPVRGRSRNFLTEAQIIN